MRRPILFLILLQTFCFGLFIPGLGFYLDDWTFLEILRDIAGFHPIRFSLKTDPSRFLNSPYFLLLFQLGGMNPLPYHIVSQCLQALEAILLFLLLDRLLRWRSLALLSAALALMFPSRDIVHVWFINSVQIMAHALVLGSMLAHLRWTESRKPALLGASLALYLCAYLSYEAVIFLPALMGGALVIRRWEEGHSPREALRATLLDLAPYALPFVLGLAWQWVVVPRILQAAHAKSSVLGFSPLHMLKVYLAGAESLTGWTARLCALGALEAWNEFGWRWILGWAGGTAAAAAAFLSLGQAPPPERSERSPLPAAGAALAGFLAAYLPYALSTGYVPKVSGLMSRVNGAGVWAGGLFAATLLCELIRRRPRLGAAALALILGAFALADWHAMHHYQRSWTLQQDILEKAARQAERLPGPATVLLGDFPAYSRMAVVFDAAWDFASALRLKTGRKDLKATVVTTRLRFGEREVIESTGHYVFSRLRYKNLYLYRYREDRLEALSGPPKPLPLFHPETDYTGLR